MQNQIGDDEMMNQKSGNRVSVLAICMFDSIHSARWLSQFTNENIDFYLFPSKKFRKIHPELSNLINSTELATYRISIVPRMRQLLSLIGYIDFLIFEKITFLAKFRISRATVLSAAIRKLNPGIIHALEIQGAGYLVLESSSELIGSTKLIVTNWGSDIYFFQDFPDHRIKIAEILSKATHYSAECERDYVLARKFGFTGEFLPCIPNAGGFQINSSRNLSVPSSRRKYLICKAYGGQFGFGSIALEVLEKVLSENSEIQVIAYSVTDDLILFAERIARSYNNFKFFSRRNPLAREELLDYFFESRAYLGLSRSDGISTSFLESMVAGAYPIQSSTSCANEWVQKGAIASVIPVDANKILQELSLVLHDDNLVDSAQIKNLEVSIAHLSTDEVKPNALSFYR